VILSSSPVNELRNRFSERQRELLCLGGALGFAFCLFSVMDYSPSDPTLLHPGPGRIENVCGPIGANVGELLTMLFGVGAWAVCVPMLVLIVGMVGKEVGSLGKWLLGLGFLCVVITSIELLVDGLTTDVSGGWVGHGLAEGARSVLGEVGSTLLLAGLFMVIATLLFEVRWGLVLSAIGRLVSILAPKMGTALKHGLAWLKPRVIRAFQTLLGLMQTGLRAMASGVAAVWQGARQSFGVFWLRVKRSFSEDKATGEPTGDWTDSGEPALGDFASLVGEFEPIIVQSSDDDATMVRQEAPLAEVQWEHTAVSEGQSEIQQDSAVLGLFPDLDFRSTDDINDADNTEPGFDERPVEQPIEISKELVKPHKVDLSGIEVVESPFLNLEVTDDGGALSNTESPQFDLPPLALLDEVPFQEVGFDEDELKALAQVVEEKLASFNIGGKVTAVRPGPVVTIFEFLPDSGIKVSKISALADDLAMGLKALRVRIVAPIPGKGVVGIEIPSRSRMTIFLRQVLASSEFKETEMALPVILGKDVEGRPMVADLARMPHLLVGGTTGSGKSVGVNGMLMSLLFSKTPDEMRLLLVDPKMLEFELYKDIPHLLHPVITEPKRASAALAWACREMDERYALLARWGTRNIDNYNRKVESESRTWTRQKALKFMPEQAFEESSLPVPRKLPYIVIVIDELADLMMVAKKDVEESIVRVAQKARACGIHLIVATQRPSVDVITGLIKANLPTRIAFQLRTAIDSRTVLDQGGAEALLGRGDMLYLPPGVGDLQRCHGAFASDEEVARVMDFLREQAKPSYIQAFQSAEEGAQGVAEEFDELYDAAVDVVARAGKASTSMIQRHFKIGYNRAARIVDQMEASGVVGPPDGARARSVLVHASGG